MNEVEYLTVGYRTFYGDYATICRAMEYAKQLQIYAGSATSLLGLSKLDIIGNGYDVASVMEHCGGYDALIRPVDKMDAPCLPSTWSQTLCIPMGYAAYQEKFKK